jgi:hypothetical protein
LTNSCGAYEKSEEPLCSPPVFKPHRTLWFLALSLAACGSKDENPQREPPPPAPKAAACDTPRKSDDPTALTLFPDKLEGFCLDPSGSDKAYGEGTKSPLDGICNIFDGECEIYLSGGVKRVVKGRYVDGGGSVATIDVYLSQFESTDAAYAMFTKRVVGDGDPAHEDTPRPIAGGGAAALGVGNAYVWRGEHLAEITYNDEAATTEAQIKTQADKLLPPLAKAFGEKLPGKTDPPESVAKLPKEGLLPLGVRLLTKDMLGVAGAGGGAFGYYREGEARWRLLSLPRGDGDQAADVLKGFGKLKGAVEEKGLGDGAYRFMYEPTGLPKTEWIVARKGPWIVGIGDEDRVLSDGMSADEHKQKTLAQDAKRDKLKAILR